MPKNFMSLRFANDHKDSTPLIWVSPLANSSLLWCNAFCIPSQLGHYNLSTYPNE